ncbi:ATP-binding protein [Paenibacillus sp. HB172176]|uniref:sensor histidine kinase n=1 Tax=Paenibacillus sp. HB172176 TaxID=2493690 RepID=UPI00143ADFE3|nr:ATP-binding protein [Paenibacillus sp. HB172176]
MNKKVVVILLSAAAAVIVYLGLMIVLPKLSPETEKTAVQGRIDLTGLEMDSTHVIPLNGEWEFYPNQLLSPSDFNSGEEAAQYAQVPTSSWSKYEPVEGQRMEKLGFGTYRLKVRLRESGQTLGFKMTNIRMSHTLYVNGNLIGHSGNPSTDAAAYAPGNTPYTAYITPSSTLVEIVIQVANFSYGTGGGIFQPIYIGSDEAIAHYRERALRNDWIVTMIYLISALLCAGMYAQHDKQRWSPLFLGVHSVMSAAYIASHGEKVMLDAIPMMSYEVFQRVQFMSGSLLSMFLLMYVYHTYREVCSKRMVVGLMSLGALFTLMPIVLPQIMNTSLESAHVLYSTLVWSYIMYLFIIASLNRMDEAGFIVPSIFAFFMHGMSYNLNIFGLVEVSSIPIVFPLLFVFMQLLMLSRRFSNAYKEAHELSQELARTDRMKDEFLARTTHEFKTPLYGIMAITDSLIQGEEAVISSRRKEGLQLVHQTAQRLSRLVHDILDLSQLKQGQLKLNPTPLDVRSSVQVVLDVFQFMIEGKEIKLVNAVGHELPPILADEFRLQQILYNLIGNALKFTEKGIISCTALQQGNEVHITITDTGIGIPQDQLQTIFEPFVQAAAASESGHRDYRDGAGIGLSIAKQLTELHGGSIGVTTEPGTGSSFTVTFPIAASHEKGGARRSAEAFRMEASAARGSKEPLLHLNGGRYTILIVDDIELNLRVLANRLGEEGYNVIAVQSGEEALAQLAQHKNIDLALLDIMMPGMSGYEVCVEIRKEYESVELPVMLLTAAIQDEEMQAAFHSGANDFLHKPFQMTELLFRVRSLLQMKQSSIERTNMEVAFLQAQIKPHFLFNVFNTIIMLSYKDVERAREVLNHLIEFLRGSFGFANTDQLVPFRTEWELVQAYLEIEKARFKDRIRVEWEIEEGAEFVLLPPLLIQPIVENAVRHGITKKADGGVIRIHAKQAEGMFIVRVEDDGVGMSKDKLDEVLSLNARSKHVGIRNIRKRLKQRYGTDLHISSELGKGTVMIMRIPLETR